MAYDSTAAAHKAWLGYVQPVGVVVSTSALLQSGAAVNANIIPLHRDFVALLPSDREGNPLADLRDFSRFATEILGWRPEDLAVPDDSLAVPISGFDETLRPTYVVKERDETILLIESVNGDFDEDSNHDGGKSHSWHASPQVRFERLLRETGHAAGLLVSPDAIRLVYAPKGESSGHITFRIADMMQVAGRPIFAALHMLLSAERLFSLADDQRLPALLIASRRHQNTVSTKLSGQVMEALFELLRGFQAAHDQTGFLAEVLRDNRDQVYAGLLTVVLRLVFVLYAEDRGLISADEVYVNNYSVGGLYKSLEADHTQHPDTMDQRYGAWARLISLFRLIFRGAQHGGMHVPGRKGYLFDPQRYPFLEGRLSSKSSTQEATAIPRVADGVIYRVLEKLLILDGERLSYRNLDVEQIGSVYEAMMGFELHVATGPSIAIKPKKRTGAPVTIDLAEMLKTAGSKRNEWLNQRTDQKVTGQSERALKEASSIEDLIAALDRRIAKDVTPNVVPEAAMIFQPSPERRRSGSHYTPRSLTQPIVEATLAPVLKDLGPRPTPEQILRLKVCDPAMGSGAFLVEACRQLGTALVEAWRSHDQPPPLPPDEDELLHARRLVAQRCLYGVDKNEMATDLAKLSLWLATLARDHEFTFLDHSLRHGDSLVGLTARQIAAFHWEPSPTSSFLEQELRQRIARVAHYRKRILDAREDTPYTQLAQELALAEQEMQLGRMAGDCVIVAFFDAEKKLKREQRRLELESELRTYLEGDLEAGLRLDGICRILRRNEKPLIPFHWDMEFPEVFDLDEHLNRRGGFDAIVGNPPFAGKNTLIEGSADGYIDWLKTVHEESHGNADLVAHFFRRAFASLRQEGCFGLIATNTIGQGDTRSTGLRWICINGGTIYRATKRLRWPGEAAVVVSVVNVRKGEIRAPYILNSRRVERITAYLFHAGGHDDPGMLAENDGKSFIGFFVLGMGFTFDDTDKDGVASPISEMKRLIEKNPSNAERIFPYLGGEEVNNNPTHSHHRYVINFEDFPLRRELDYSGAVAEDWPDLLAIVREKVKPERDRQSRDSLRLRWWQYAEKRPGLVRSLRMVKRVFVVNCGASPFPAIARLPVGSVFSHTLAVFTLESMSAFAVLQSRPHEIWARFMASSMKDDLRYTPSDCFETFPFPKAYEANHRLDDAGKNYYDFRAQLMVGNDEGLTKTYNRFHRPDERSADIQRLRELHALMDREVLDAYGWKDISVACDFFPEFEEDDDEEADTGRARQKKYRYRWPDEIHDEVLARLLALNKERAGATSEMPAARPPARKARGPKSLAKESEPTLFR